MVPRNMSPVQNCCKTMSQAVFLGRVALRYTNFLSNDRLVHQLLKSQTWGPHKTSRSVVAMEWDGPNIAMIYCTSSIYYIHIYTHVYIYIYIVVP